MTCVIIENDNILYDFFIDSEFPYMVNELKLFNGSLYTITNRTFELLSEKLILEVKEKINLED